MRPQQHNLTVSTDGGVAIVTWHVPGRTVRVVNHALLSDLRAALDAILTDDGVRGVVLVWGKPGSLSDWTGP